MKNEIFRQGTILWGFAPILRAGYGARSSDWRTKKSLFLAKFLPEIRENAAGQTI